MSAGEGPATTSSTLTAPSRGFPRLSPTTWLWVAVGLYFVVSFSLSWLRAAELETTTWDQGLYQQALWSTAHGRTFYEAADLETGGYRSLLQVHTVLLLYLLVPLYNALPYQTTLFAVQSLVVAAASVPLYFLARDLTRSDRLALVAAVLFLAWTPTLSSTLYDFHAEAFLPIELFAVVLFWERERYLVGALVAGVAFATFELAPVLLAFVALFFLLPFRGPTRDGTASPDGEDGARGSRFRTALSTPRVRASLFLLAASVAAYSLLVYYRVDWLQASLGTSTVLLPSHGYVIGFTPGGLDLSVANLSVGFEAKVTYWVVILALLGFVPLLAPRALLVTVPWFVFTLLSPTTTYVELGFQYGFVAGATLLVAFAYGLPRARALAEAWTAHPPHAEPTEASPSGSRGWLRRLDRNRGAMVAALVLLVGLNVALSPVNPVLQGQGPGSGYLLSYSVGAGYPSVEKLAGLIPGGASVVASDNLFPLVANDVNAYTLPAVPGSLLVLPFTEDRLPQFVFLASDRTAAVPAWLAGELYSPGAYGVRAVAWTSPAGPVLLYEDGYTGPSSVYGSAPPVSFTDVGGSLTSHPAGYIPSRPSGPTPGAEDVAASIPGALGMFFTGPWVGLSAGTYSATLLVSVEATPGDPAPAASEPALWVGSGAFAQAPFFGATLAFASVSGPAWAPVSFTFTVAAPSIEFEVQGIVLGTNVQAFLESLDVTAVPP
jgi:uncharacterized membrane protein